MSAPLPSAPLPSTSVRLLALTLTALCSIGFQRAFEARIVDAVVVRFLGSVKAPWASETMTRAVDALTAHGLMVERDGWQIFVRGIDPASGVDRSGGIEPSAEGIGLVLDSVVRERARRAGLPDDVRVIGVSATLEEAVLHLRGGMPTVRTDDPGSSARAAIFAQRWLERHFPELGARAETRWGREEWFEAGETCRQLTWSRTAARKAA